MKTKRVFVGIMLAMAFCFSTLAFGQDKKDDKKKEGDKKTESATTGKTTTNKNVTISSSSIIDEDPKKKKKKKPSYDFFKDPTANDAVTAARQRNMNMERELKKPQYSNPQYFGHKKPPKKRPAGKKKMCKECGLAH